MDADILLILLQDGVVNGAIYALLALSLVLVFAVTRVILIPQGEIVAYGALTYAALDAGRVPASVWLLCALGVGAFAAGLFAIRHTLRTRAVLALAVETLLVPGIAVAATLALAPARPGIAVSVLLTLAIVTPMAPYIYRIAFQPLAEASVLVLLIASVGVHWALVGLGLVLFGPEGYRASGFSDARVALGSLVIPGQALWIVGTTLALMAGLALFFGRSLYGKALHATAVNRLGARLVGIATSLAGAHGVPDGGAIGTLSGILIAPLTTVYYDSGFLIGLKGFVAAIVGGLVSYPLAAAAAILVGCVESLSSFYASAFKEVIVFTVILPVLLWRSLRSPAEEDEAPAAPPGSRLAGLPLLPVPLFWITLANYAGIAAIVAVGLVVLTGYGGMTSFGQATFMGFGAYTTALLTTQAGLSPWLALPCALVVSGVAAVLLGAVTLRLSGHYLALGTLAWSVSLYYVFANLDLFGRNDGISGIPPLRLGEVALTSSRAYFPVVYVALGLVLLLTRNLLDSRAGRAIRALRGGAGAAASFGVDLARTRMLAFAYAAVLAGLAGWLYAHMQRSVNPTPFGLNAGIEYLLMAVVGGAGALPGALLGAGLVTVVNDQLQNVLPRLLGQSGNYETIVFGLLLVLLLQTAPEGLWPLLRRTRRAAGPQRIPDAPPLSRRALPAAGSRVLQATGLRKAFGGLVAVNDIDLHLDAGEIVGLIGPNGAGKSTTFNLLTGVARPSGGRMQLLGQVLAEATPQRVARLGVARSFQHVKLVPGMSVIENVAIGAHLRGRAGPLPALLRLDRAEERALFAEAARQIARVGLDAAGRPADSLALGQQRVVEIARALCLDPALLLLDEPAAGLRHAEKQELAALLRRLRADGVTILLVEHDMEFVMGLADRLVVMEFGTKLAEGRAADVRADPRVIEAYLGAPA